MYAQGPALDDGGEQGAYLVDGRSAGRLDPDTEVTSNMTCGLCFEMAAGRSIRDVLRERQWSQTQIDEHIQSDVAAAANNAQLLHEAQAVRAISVLAVPTSTPGPTRLRIDVDSDDDASPLSTATATHASPGASCPDAVRPWDRGAETPLLAADPVVGRGASSQLGPARRPRATMRGTSSH